MSAHENIFLNKSTYNTTNTTHRFSWDSLFVCLFLMVLELYCRKVGIKREGKKRERGQPWPRGERGKGEREGGLYRDESKKGESFKSSLGTLTAVGF
jgi:hypothetical protein